MNKSFLNIFLLCKYRIYISLNIEYKCEIMKKFIIYCYQQKLPV